MTDWTAIANEVTAVLGGPDLNLTMALRKSTKSGPDYAPVFTHTYHKITGAQFDIKERDAAGTFIGVTGNRLLVSVDGEAPYKGDEVMIEGAAAFLSTPDDADWDGKPITGVEDVSPAGVAVLFKVFVDG